MNTTDRDRPADLAPAVRGPWEWRPLLLRMFVVVVPAQVVGAILGGLPLALIPPRTLLDNLWLATFPVVGAGVVSGVALGLLVRPVAGRLLSWAGVGAAFGLASWAVLMVLVNLAVADGATSPGWSSFASGALVLVGLQTALSVGLWWGRLRR